MIASDFIAWSFRMPDALTRRSLMLIAFPLAVLNNVPHALSEGRLFTFAWWRFQWRIWWVIWDGTMIDQLPKDNS